MKSTIKKAVGFAVNAIKENFIPAFLSISCICLIMWLGLRFGYLQIETMSIMEFISLTGYLIIMAALAILLFLISKRLSLALLLEVVMAIVGTIIHVIPLSITIFAILMLCSVLIVNKYQTGVWLGGFR